MMDRRYFLLAGVALGGSVTLGGCNMAPRSTLRPMAFPGRPQAMDRVWDQVSAAGLRFGAPVHLIAYKQERIIEVWLQSDKGPYRRYGSYNICAFSGDLGPKLREGDRQTPEGFYEILPAMLNPGSAFHLGINLGFPNHYDRAHGRTGSLIAIHGGCASIGCYALGDRGVEEIYLILEQAFLQGAKRATLAAYPFRPTAQNLAAMEGHRWEGFWKNIFQSHAHFEAYGHPPYYTVLGGSYVFTPYPAGTSTNRGFPESR